MAKDATVSLSNPKERAKIEAKRGIVRDGEGHIVRSKEWKKDRKVQLESKLEDLQNRTKNVKAELKAL